MVYVVKFAIILGHYLNIQVVELLLKIKTKKHSFLYIFLIRTSVCTNWYTKNDRKLFSMIHAPSEKVELVQTRHLII